MHPKNYKATGISETKTNTATDKTNLNSSFDHKNQKVGVAQWLMLHSKDREDFTFEPRILPWARDFKAVVRLVPGWLENCWCSLESQLGVHFHAFFYRL